MNLRIPALGYILAAVSCHSYSPRFAFPDTTAASCAGALDCHGESCCLALPIPMTPAAGQERAYLDKYEVTVGRFRRFAATFTGYRDGFPSSPAELQQLLKCDDHATWTDAPGSQENLPINCVSWKLASSFCTWDGGRLPTSQEWEFAAMGGDEHRLFPWGKGPPPDCTWVNTELEGQSGEGCPRQPWPVGKSRSRARWGHADLAGNVAEWILDQPNPRSDGGSAQVHLVQNASWNLHAIDDLQSTHKSNPFPTQADGKRPAACDPEESCDVFVSMTPPGWQVSSSIGFRCVRIVH
jgi:formylglycine-generating enzyme required for sulfatase activity